MDVNVVIGAGPPAPAASPVALAPTPDSRADLSVPTPSPVSTGAELVSAELKGLSVKDVLDVRGATNVRSGTRLHLDGATDRIVAQIVNAENEVIRQLPPEEVLKIIAQFRKVVGLIFDKQI